jgi:hypothetical protein
VWHPYKRRMSHIRVVLVEKKKMEKTLKTKAKKEEKPAKKETKKKVETKKKGKTK